MAREFNKISQSLVRKLFSYNEVTGELTWIVCLSNRSPIGKVVSTVCDDGYLTVTIYGVSYQAHRIIWIYHFGDIPLSVQIDHRDRVRSNNRLNNLRLATQSQNSINKIIKNKNGYRGVKANGKGFQARIVINGKRVGLGTFESAELAYEAYLSASREHYLEFSTK